MANVNIDEVVKSGRNTEIGDGYVYGSNDNKAKANMRSLEDIKLLSENMSLKDKLKSLDTENANLKEVLRLLSNEIKNIKEKVERYL